MGDTNTIRETVRERYGQAALRVMEGKYDNRPAGGNGASKPPEQRTYEDQTL